MLWCWRCKAEMPMLDEVEAKAVFADRVFSDLLQGRTASPVLAKQQWHQRVLERYEKLTGFKETNINAVCHHQLSLYGEPCRKCKKLLRTPQARFCAACGFRRSDS